MTTPITPHNQWTHTRIHMSYLAKLALLANLTHRSAIKTLERLIDRSLKHKLEALENKDLLDKWYSEEHK